MILKKGKGYKVRKDSYILIGGAWPYANSSLHLGHIAGLLPGDILARYYRLIGCKVLYVSGTDCHGTPITERAKKEKTTPKEIATHYHKEFSEVFKNLEFSYDLYGETEDDYHKKEVEKIFRKIYDNGYIYEKIEPDIYCENCGKFVADRELKLECPECHNETKGDQCDCGYIPTVEDLKKAICIDCGNKVTTKDNKNLYLELTKIQDIIEKYVNDKKNNWRKNAQNETEKYLREGLRDRAVTRDLDWGVNIPVDGYENKKMYVWIDAVLGYLTLAKKYCENNNLDWENWWKNDRENKIYMVHGKDNITFHSIILPGLLLSINENIKFPDVIVSTEYLNFNDKKFSKSKGIGITALEAIDLYNVDTLRFHLIKNGPEKKDTNFTEEDYKATHNELTNKLGNLVNRTLKYKGITNIPAGKMNTEIEKTIKENYSKISNMVENLEFREATNIIMGFVEDMNKFYDESKPWVQIKDNVEEFNNTIYTCCTAIANIANYIEPFMPETSKKIRKYLGITDANWDYIEVQKGLELKDIEPLFEKM